MTRGARTDVDAAEVHDAPNMGASTRMRETFGDVALPCGIAAPSSQSVHQPVRRVDALECPRDAGVLADVERDGRARAGGGAHVVSSAGERGHKRASDEAGRSDDEE